MNKSGLKRTIKSVERVLTKYSPGILTGIGIAGMIGATFMAVKATPKALYLIETKKEESEVEELTSVETIKTCWTCYIPATLTTILSAACLIGASTVSAKRNAALATAYSISEAALREYQEKVVEVVGEKKEKAVRDAVAKNQIERDPVTKSEVVIIDSNSNTLCYEPLSGRYFKSTIDKIKKAEIKLDRQMIQEMYVSLNDFYWEIGLDGTALGDKMGWNLSKGYMDLSFSSQLADDGTPCAVIVYGIPPVYDYQNYYTARNLQVL